MPCSQGRSAAGTFLACTPVRGHFPRLKSKGSGLPECHGELPAELLVPRKAQSLPQPWLRDTAGRCRCFLWAGRPRPRGKSYETAAQHQAALAKSSLATSSLTPSTTASWRRAPAARSLLSATCSPALEPGQGLAGRGRPDGCAATPCPGS